MNRTEPAPVLPSTGREVLTRALAGLRTGQIVWGRDWFRDQATDCSCIVGIVAWAADPTYEDRDPFVMAPERRTVAWQALEAIAAVLLERGELPPYPDHEDAVHLAEVDERLAPLNLLSLGRWNDALSSPLPVLEVLEAALERAK